VARLRWSLAALPLPRWDDGRIRLAVDVSNWLRPDAETSPERLFCRVYGRGKSNAQMIPGWLLGRGPRGRTGVSVGDRHDQP
jgi:DDE superfamily endonuclease